MLCVLCSDGERWQNLSSSSSGVSDEMVWPSGLQEVVAAAMFSCFVVDFL